jgi:hypothetical protein
MILLAFDRRKSDRAKISACAYLKSQRHGIFKSGSEQTGPAGLIIKRYKESL